MDAWLHKWTLKNIFNNNKSRNKCVTVKEKYINHGFILNNF